MPSPDIRPYTLSPHNVGLSINPETGRFVWPEGKPSRRIAVIHGSGGWRAMRDEGIFDSDEYVIFSLNNFWPRSRDSQDRLRADCWFELHTPTPGIQDPNDMQWLRECPVPIYTTEPFPENPRAVRWPLEYYVRKYGRSYFACSFAAEILTAFEEGFEELRLYGLSLLLGTKRECTVESSNVNFWLGYVMGRGMRVVIHEDDFLLRHEYVYGFQYWKERRWVEDYLSTFDQRPVAM